VEQRFPLRQAQLWQRRFGDDFRGRMRSSGETIVETEVKRMSKSVLLVGTRKGLFVLESGDRRDWSVRGPYCESWPVYQAVLDGESETIYAAAASEWLGSAIWRSADLGETWEHSSEGLGYPDEDGGLKLSKVSSVVPAHGRLLVGAESAGLFQSTDGGETFSLVTTFEGQEGREAWNDPAQQPPGHLGLSAIIPHPEERDRFWIIVQGYSLFETTDGGETWSPRNKGLRRDWPAEYEEIGFCVHKVAPTSDFERFYQQNHVGMHRSDDAGKTWTEITEGLPTEFGFAAAAHPHDRDTFYVIPLDPGHGRTMPDGHASVWRTRDAGSSWQRLDNGLPTEDAYVGVLREGMAFDTQDEPGLYFGTSTGQLFASTDEGERWDQIGGLFPGITSVTVAAVD
jgi:photosystem II stability/assembly factor-like uncharacterized protein